MSTYLFIVQGEGRGHMTQAMSFFGILRAAGHSCQGVLVGKSRQRELPEFVAGYFDCPVTRYAAPNFIKNRKKKKYLIHFSLLINFFKIPVYLHSVFQIRRLVKKTRPDFVVNFYEPLAGILRILPGNKVPMVSVAHQYCYFLPGFVPEGRPLHRFYLKLLTRISAIGSDRLFAIHIREIEGSDKIVIIPPLLRKKVMEIIPESGEHFTIYTLNPGYTEEISEWHKEHPEFQLEFFTDGSLRSLHKNTGNNLRVYPVSEDKFIRSMASCRALITTAGYESICEASWLGKPVMMIPVEDHAEQKTNASLFTKAGMGITETGFDPRKIVNFAKTFKPDPVFQGWIKKARQIIPEEIEKLLNQKNTTI